MDIQTLIFDFDYTLADSSRAVIDCIDFALRGLGLDPVSDEAACRTIGLPVSETLLALVGERHRDQCDAFSRLFMQRADQVMTLKTRLFDYTPQTIRRLREAGLTLGIVSTKRRYRIEEILARDDMLAPFDLIVGGEDVTRHKPDPQSLLLALDRLGVDPARTLYIGDSVIDAQAAQNAGLVFVAVLSGTTPRDAFATYPTYVILQDLSELPTLLDGRRDNAQNSKTLSRGRFGQFAQRYVTSRSHAQGNDLNRLLDIAQPQPHWHVLDVATGGGHTALKFAPYVASVVASDLTPAMLDAAKAFITAQGAGNVQFKLADAEALPFDAATFDLVTCRIAPHH
ncbi:MAG: HAD-IA family hydrolase, partial [Anaerolineae bacterium]|nr:HAD-IA family hydrolase [Anaerolineae bacterium]